MIMTKEHGPGNEANALVKTSTTSRVKPAT